MQNLSGIINSVEELSCDAGDLAGALEYLNATFQYIGGLPLMIGSALRVVYLLSQQITEQVGGIEVALSEYRSRYGVEEEKTQKLEPGV